MFERDGVRWLHTGGIFAGLSGGAALVIEAAMRAAKENGTIVSYDLNYRPSLWKAYGGPARAQNVNRKLAPYVDVMIGNEEDFTLALGFEVEGTGKPSTTLDPELFKRMITKVTSEIPTLAIVATTLRGVTSANINDWGAIAWSRGQFHQANTCSALEIYDRVGGGDSFAAGLIIGLLTGRGVASAMEYGAAHGALAMTTPGDTSMASRAEVESLVNVASARVRR